MNAGAADGAALTGGASPANASIRPLAPGDVDAYRRLMLEAYAAHPDAFTSTAAERALLPRAWWERRVGASPDSGEMALGAFVDANLVGAAGLAFEARDKVRHKATLFGMYVAPAFRRRRLARLLVGAALEIAEARPQTRLVQLTVTDGNTAAEALYAACGFRRFGVEPFAVRVGDGFVAKAHMWRPVKPLPDDAQDCSRGS